jgi:N-acetylglucosamine-6-sulfatase
LPARNKPGPNTPLSPCCSVGALDNTYILYGSDHGYNLGQFGIPSHKTQVYDHVTRIPFMIAGPGISPGSRVQEISSYVDITPTLLDLAGFKGNQGDGYSNRMDGRSFAPFLHGGGSREDWKDAALIEYQSIHAPDRTWGGAAGGLPGIPVRYTDAGNNTFVGLRIINATHDLLYAEFAELSDWDFSSPYFYELYDQTVDPFQKENIYPKAPPGIKAELHRRLHRARTCTAGGCSLK